VKRDQAMIWPLTCGDASQRLSARGISSQPRVPCVLRAQRPVANSRKASDTAGPGAPPRRRRSASATSGFVRSRVAGSRASFRRDPGAVRHLNATSLTHELLGLPQAVQLSISLVVAVAHGSTPYVRRNEGGAGRLGALRQPILNAMPSATVAPCEGTSTGAPISIVGPARERPKGQAASASHFAWRDVVIHD